MAKSCVRLRMMRDYIHVIKLAQITTAVDYDLSHDKTRQMCLLV